MGLSMWEVLDTIGCPSSFIQMLETSENFGTIAKPVEVHS